MLMDLDTDQQFFRDTTARFLAEHAPVSELRRLRDDPIGYQADYWRKGVDLGWTSLLVSEACGGGTLSGRGLVDLTLLAHEFGAHASPGPFLPTNIAAGLLSDAGGGGDDSLLARLLDGSATAAWCAAGDRLEIAVTGDGVTIDGAVRPVEAAVSADVYVVTGRTADGWTTVAVPRGTPGVDVRPLETVDLTRRFAAVTFDRARLPSTAVIGEPSGAAAAAERARLRALVISCAESVGAMEAAFDMTVEWAFDRYSFGRPLASYQELKHRFADMKMWLEASHAVTDAAAAAVQSGEPDAGELASVAKAYVGEYGTELVQDCVQLHGGIGVTFEHDLHLVLRRVVLNRALLGTPAEHRRQLARWCIDRDAA